MGATNSVPRQHDVYAEYDLSDKTAHVRGDEERASSVATLASAAPDASVSGCAGADEGEGQSRGADSEGEQVARGRSADSRRWSEAGLITGTTVVTAKRCVSPTASLADLFSGDGRDKDRDCGDSVSSLATVFHRSSSLSSNNTNTGASLAKTGSLVAIAERVKMEAAASRQPPIPIPVPVHPIATSNPHIAMRRHTLPTLAIDNLSLSYPSSAATTAADNRRFSLGQGHPVFSPDTPPLASPSSAVSAPGYVPFSSYKRKMSFATSLATLSDDTSHSAPSASSVAVAPPLAPVKPHPVSVSQSAAKQYPVDLVAWASMD
ncbi:hypothetical protein BC830DRAFT_1077579 [Chytriomyces sp. MP71]|nr:hypothetical protein BC830DRAFT_1077579 [Chytriomyces sp. MP71]